ncbi:MAG: SDR family NAD(P)-dependent oxidoreductase [Myxococcales bacterium]|nr:SDR family NAD(P)-dependent oxidoreductase [Myxococcales bacterium]
MQSLSGKTFFVTGANTGIGKATAFELARRGGHVVLACRSEDKTRPVMAEIEAAVPGAKLDFVSLDLGSLDAVERCAKAYLDSGAPIDVLVNNAGLAGSTGTTKDGHEITIGTNHVGPFLLTELLLPRLREAPEARVVNVASRAHFRQKALDVGMIRRPASSAAGSFAYYAQSKLMNVLHAKALAEALRGTKVTTYSLHPGVVASDVWRKVPWPFRGLIKLFMVTNEEGARTQLRCATDPSLASESGRYYDAERERTPSQVALDPRARDELDAWSRELVKKHLENA